MRCYIATGLKNHAQHNAVRDALIRNLDAVTYDWTVHGAVRDQGVARIQEVARLEFEGVYAADAVIVLLPDGLASSGRGTHVELGIALGRGRPVIIWSDVPGIFESTSATCAFYHHPQVVRTVSGPFDAERIVRALRSLNNDVQDGP